MNIRAEIESEADHHIALGLLLRKDRAEPKRGAVRKVLSHPLTLTQKIEAIRKIDDMTDALDVLRVVRAASAQGARNHADRVRLTIKKEIATVSYFRFLFGDFPLVQKFCRGSYVMEARLLPPGMRVDPHLAGFLATKMRALGKQLSQRLMPVVEDGWLHLRPKQYNLLVLLKRLADRVHTFEFHLLDLHRPNTIDHLRRIESIFLMLHYDPETLRALADALRLWHTRRHEAAGGAEETIALVLQLLAEDCMVPSLYRCLLGLNMLKHRRFLTLKDLMKEGLGEIVDVSRFDFDASIRTRMEGRINDSLQSVKMLHAQLMDARSTNSYIALDGQGRPDLAALRDLYESLSSRPVFSFTADQANLVLFTSRLLRGFDKGFSPLLNGQCLLEGEGKVTVFVPSFFALDFTKLRALAEKLEQELFHFSSFPLTHYLRIKGGQLQAIGHEMEVSQLIRQGAGCLADLGRTIVKVLSLRSSVHVDSPGGLEPIILHGRAFSLPYEGRRILAPSIVSGLTIAEALSRSVTVCFSAGVLLQDDFVSLFLSRERRLEHEVRRQMAFLENALDPESYQELAEVYR